MKDKVELLLPAGNKEKLDYAINYGADAVYMGMVDFSLRTMRKGEIITAENLKDTINLAHSYNKKVYMTLNIYAYDEDIKNLYANIDLIKDANPDALIVSDFGILNVLRNKLPNIDIHISTQTNTLNSEAVKFWRDFGATRVILARELSIRQLSEIRKNVPDIELEVFVHGAQCVSLSGRCLLSDYMTHGERKANHGGCSQPCRWKYKLLEETRPGEYYEIEETARGTHILSTKDLALINYIPKLIEAGADSFKIEGRTKSLYYVSAVAKAYRRAIDAYYNNEKVDEEEEDILKAIMHPSYGDKRDEFGRTILIRAIKNRHFEPYLYPVLVTSPMELNARDNEGRTALYYLARTEYPECLEILTRMGAIPFCIDAEGNNVLHILLGGDWKITLDDIVYDMGYLPKELITMKNADGKTPLDIIRDRLYESKSE